VRSFRNHADGRRKVFLSLSGSIESQLRDAYAKRNAQDGLTQADIAKKLNVDRSAIHHRLTGRRNMTVETIADMVWALGHRINVDIFDPAERPEDNYAPAEEPDIVDLPDISILPPPELSGTGDLISPKLERL
jgi:hypothetical protein